MTLRLGELMIERGLMTQDQVQRVLDHQRAKGGAFGDIAERMFDLHPADVEGAWASQYASIAQRVDPSSEDVSEEALALVSTRQAWQFRMVPLRIERGEAVVCTTEELLPRALRFAYRMFRQPVYFVIGQPKAVERTLSARYPMPGMGPDGFPAHFAAALASSS